MKKAALILAVLLVLAVGSLPWIHGIINEQKESVTITEEVLAGNASAASGLVVEALTYMDGHLYWETTFRPGSEAAAETEFTFERKPRPKSYGSTAEPELQVGMPSTDFVLGHVGPGEFEELADRVIADPILDVLSRAPVGEDYTEVVKLKDYFDVYPLVIEYTGMMGMTEETRPGIYEQLTEFFSIPVPEDERLEITIESDELGNETTIRCRTQEESVSQKPRFYGTLVEEGGYLILKPYEAMRADHGIYFFPMVEGAEGQIPDLSQMRSVYPVEKDANVRQLYYHRDLDQLMLFTEEQGRLWMTVIDRMTMEPLQRVDLGNIVETEAMSEIVIDGSLFMITIYDKIDQEAGIRPRRMVLLEWGEVNWERKLSSSLNWPGEAESDFRDDVEETAVLAWDGQKLAIVQWSKNFSTCDVYVRIFEHDTLAYVGVYHRNDTKKNYYRSDISITPWNREDGLKAYWN
ncbi:MAG: hypothetical protein IKD13_03630 [Firmicutes bacterium]|nr:hypothetical protein [Bacillota bacterium]